MDHEDFVKSRERSFVRYWSVQEDYRIVEGYIRPVADGKLTEPRLITYGGRAGDYMPMAEPDLVGQLAKAATDNETDVLSFVKRYGLLGYAVAWRREEEAGVQRLSPADHKGKPPGDPLPWFRAHARNVKLVLGLLGALDDEAVLRTRLDELKMHAEHREDAELLELPFANRGYLRPFRVEALPIEPRFDALKIIARILNSNLTGVPRTIEVEDQDDGSRRLVSLFAPCNLADCVYWHLADAAVGGWVRQCADPKCRAFFVAQSGRVKYCPPPMGNLSVSPCMNRHKQRKLRRTTAEAIRRVGEGEPIDVVAQELGSTVATVRGWVKQDASRKGKRERHER